MALYAIADLHLSTLESTNKSMEVFGRRWFGYTEKLKNNWQRIITDEDTVVIPGDVSWALTLEEAESDLRFLDALPGKKILGKGNHDFWWSTMKKHKAFLARCGITSISFLYNNAHVVGDFILAGTRGWFYDEDIRAIPKNSDFEKIAAREALRLEMSLTEAEKLKEKEPDKEIIVFTHFPPKYEDQVCENLIPSLKNHGIKRLYYGHVHGNYTLPDRFVFDDIEMNIISADYLSFIPKHIHKIL